MARNPLFDDDNENEHDTRSPGTALGAPGRARRRQQADDMDAVELGDEGVDVNIGSSVLASVLLDPERVRTGDDDGSHETDQAEIEDAERFDLSQFQARSSGALKDAYETWVESARRHGFLSDEEMLELTLIAQGGDPVKATEAEEILIRHNVRWIIKCLQASVGSEPLKMPSDYRNDLLSWARWGFVRGIRGFNHEKALSRSATSRRKSVLGYTKIWINKEVQENVAPERYGLEQDPALERKLCLRVRDELHALLDRTPSYDEISARLEEMALAKLARKYPGRRKDQHSPRDLRKAGALGPERVKELVEHHAQTLSLDMPASDSGEDGPSLADYIAESGQGAEGVALASELEVGLEARLRQIPNRNRRFALRMLAGLRAERGVRRYNNYNPEEVGAFLGRTRDSILGYEAQMREQLAAEETVSEDMLTRPGFSFSIAGLKSAKGEIPDTVLDEIRALVSLERLLARDGVRLRLGRRAPCPCGTAACVLQASEDMNSFACSGCGREGDIFGWLEQHHGLERRDAVIAAARIAIDLPKSLVREDGAVVVTRDPARRRNAQQLS